VSDCGELVGVTHSKPYCKLIDQDAGEGSSGSPEHGFTKTKSLISKNKSMAFERIKRNGSKVSSSQNSPPSSSH